MDPEVILSVSSLIAAASGVIAALASLYRRRKAESMMVKSLLAHQEELRPLIHSFLAYSMSDVEGQSTALSPEQLAELQAKLIAVSEDLGGEYRRPILEALTQGSEKGRTGYITNLLREAHLLHAK